MGGVASAQICGFGFWALGQICGFGFGHLGKFVVLVLGIWASAQICGFEYAKSRFLTYLELKRDKDKPFRMTV